MSLCYKIDKVHICIKSDNSSAVRYIYNQGGSVMSLFKDYERHFLWCDEKSLWYQQFTQRGKNITADCLSRAFSDSTEWKLNERVFQKICKTLFYPEKDLFAFRFKKKPVRFVSWFPDPMAITYDGIFFSWTDYCCMSVWIYRVRNTFCFLGVTIFQITLLSSQSREC